MSDGIIKKIQLPNGNIYDIQSEAVIDLGYVDAEEYDYDIEAFLNTLLESGEYKLIWGDGDDFEYFVVVESLVEDGNGFVYQKYWYTEEGSKSIYHRSLQYEDGELVDSSTDNYLTLNEASLIFASSNHNHYETASKAMSVWDFCNSSDLTFNNAKPFIIYKDTLNDENWLIERYIPLSLPANRLIRVTALGDASAIYQRSGVYNNGTITWDQWKTYPSNSVTDVLVNNSSVVNNGVAQIDLSNKIDTAGIGLVKTGTTLKTKLNSETSLGTIGTTDKLYPVGIDSNGQLCTSVPWDMGYSCESEDWDTILSDASITTENVSGYTDPVCILTDGIYYDDYAPLTLKIEFDDGNHEPLTVYCDNNYNTGEVSSHYGQYGAAYEGDTNSHDFSFYPFSIELSLAGEDPVLDIYTEEIGDYTFSITTVNKTAIFTSCFISAVNQAVLPPEIEPQIQIINVEKNEQDEYTSDVNFNSSSDYAIINYNSKCYLYSGIKSTKAFGPSYYVFINIEKGVERTFTIAQQPFTATPDVITYSEQNIVPTNVSSFTNDAGYLTSFTETDPTVPSWAKASTKPSYNFSEIGSTPTTISGYGLTDAYTKTEVDNLILSAAALDSTYNSSTNTVTLTVGPVDDADNTEY